MGGVRPSSEVSASPFGLKVSNIVQEGRVEYVLVIVPPFSAPVPSSLCASSGKSKKRKESRNPVKLPRCIEVASSEAHRKRTHVEKSSFRATLNRYSHGKSQRSGRNRKAAPVFQGGLP